MYNAMASYESAGSKGSTRLHMDMADAVNIMTYASPTPDGKPGSAAWDLFRACDADKLRAFLRRKLKGSYQHDPIHSQQIYLDTTLRKELFDMYGIKSHRVYQKPGEAVFIPAGCAHQVRSIRCCRCLHWAQSCCRSAISRIVSRLRSTLSAPRTSRAASSSRKSLESKTSRWCGRRMFSSCAR